MGDTGGKRGKLKQIKAVSKSRSFADLRSEAPSCHEELFGLLTELQKVAESTETYGGLMSDIRRDLEEELKATRNKSVAEFEVQNQRLSLVIADARTRLALETEDRREREARVSELGRSNSVLQSQIDELEHLLSSCPTATQANKSKPDFSQVKAEFKRNKAHIQRLEEELRSFEEREATLLHMLKSTQRDTHTLEDSLTMDLSASEVPTGRDDL